MKKLMISAVMAFALMTSISVMAQDSKKSTSSSDKTKTEACCKKDAEKKECCKKDAEKKECCAAKAEPKK